MRESIFASRGLAMGPCALALVLGGCVAESATGLTEGAVVQCSGVPSSLEKRAAEAWQILVQARNSAEGLAAQPRILAELPAPADLPDQSFGRVFSGQAVGSPLQLEGRMEGFEDEFVRRREFFGFDEDGALRWHLGERYDIRATGDRRAIGQVFAPGASATYLYSADETADEAIDLAGAYARIREDASIFPSFSGATAGQLRAQAEEIWQRLEGASLTETPTILPSVETETAGDFDGQRGGSPVAIEGRRQSVAEGIRRAEIFGFSADGELRWYLAETRAVDSGEPRYAIGYVLAGDVWRSDLYWADPEADESADLVAPYAIIRETASIFESTAAVPCDGAAAE